MLSLPPYRLSSDIYCRLWQWLRDWLGFTRFDMIKLYECSIHTHTHNLESKFASPIGKYMPLHTVACVGWYKSPPAPVILTGTIFARVENQDPGTLPPWGWVLALYQSGVVNYHFLVAPHRARHRYSYVEGFESKSVLFFSVKDPCVRLVLYCICSPYWTLTYILYRKTMISMPANVIVVKFLRAKTKKKKKGKTQHRMLSH